MNHQRYRTSLALLLAAAMLFGSMTPPIVRHAHAKGDRQHDHRATESSAHGHGPHHGHSHSHGHAHSHHHPHNTGSRAAEESTSHLHLTLFGFVWTLPQDADAPFEEDCNPSNRPAFIHWIDDDFTVTSATTFDFRSNCLPLDASIDCELHHCPQCSEIAQTMLASLPLCDAARLERSGVQQI